MNSIFCWHFHRIINFSVKDIDQNLSQHTERLPKMPQMDNVHGGIKLLEKLSPLWSSGQDGQEFFELLHFKPTLSPETSKFPNAPYDPTLGTCLKFHPFINPFTTSLIKI